MDKIRMLQNRRSAVKSAGKSVRADIAALCDEASFVELSTFSFSKSELFPEGAAGEGVVAGFITIDGYPFCVVAQNGEVLGGGVSEAGCKKIAKCLSGAEKSNTPVIYMLSSKGVRIGEGVNALEGLAEVLLKAAQLKGSVLQFCIIDGEISPFVCGVYNSEIIATIKTPDCYPIYNITHIYLNLLGLMMYFITQVIHVHHKLF